MWRRRLRSRLWRDSKRVDRWLVTIRASTGVSSHISSPVVGGRRGRGTVWGQALGTLLTVASSTDLLDDEEVLVDVRPHWVFFLGPLILTVAAVAVVVGVVRAFPTAPVEVVWLLVALVGLPTAWLLGRLVRWFSTRLVVTERRIVLRSGVLARRCLNLRLQRVVDTHCIQRPLQRLVGSGQLVVEVEGDEQGLALYDVRRPRTLQRVINRQLLELDRRSITPGSCWPVRGRPASRDFEDLDPTSPTPPRGIPAVQPASSLSDQLVALDRLRRQGILSEDEFAAKKAELLRRI
jgi:membrane protein YdbS with pleckstrin-like domain